jgi:hypothetical protein
MKNYGLFASPDLLIWIINLAKQQTVVFHFKLNNYSYYLCFAKSLPKMNYFPKVVVYLFFVDLGKKIRWDPPVNPSGPAAIIIFLVHYFKQFIFRSQPPSTTPCPIAIAASNASKEKLFLKYLNFTITL